MQPLKITILVNKGPDHLMIEINKPEGCWPYNGNASVKMEVAHKSGQKYCQENFPGVPIEIITV